MTENAILVLFLVLPTLLFFGARRFFRTTKPKMDNQKTAALLIGGIWIVGFVASAGLLAGEVYYRYVYDQADTVGMCKATARWFERHFQTNNGGFRDDHAYEPSVSPGHRRISLLGDSYTAGQGINDINDRFVGELANRRPDQEVHALAICGWSTSEQLKLTYYMPQAEQSYDLDVAVLVYNFDDISDIAPEWDAELTKAFEGVGDEGLTRNSYLIDTLTVRPKVARLPQLIENKKLIHDAYSGATWERQKGRLTSLQESMTSQGGKFHVMTFPVMHALGPDYPYREEHEKLAAFWQELDVPHLDLLDVFEGHTAEDLTLAPYDSHPNQKAHQLAAAALDEFLGDLE